MPDYVPQYLSEDEAKEILARDGSLKGPSVVSAPNFADMNIDPYHQEMSAPKKVPDMLEGLLDEDAALFNKPFSDPYAKKEEPIKTVTVSESINARKSVQPKEDKDKMTTNELDTLSVMIKNSKKSEVDLEMTFKAKIPVSAFFQTMDDTFVKKNQNALLQTIIESIKTNEFEKSLKAHLKEFYGLK